MGADSCNCFVRDVLYLNYELFVRCEDVSKVKLLLYLPVSTTIQTYVLFSGKDFMISSDQVG